MASVNILPLPDMAIMVNYDFRSVKHINYIFYKIFFINKKIYKNIFIKIKFQFMKEFIEGYMKYRYFYRLVITTRPNSKLLFLVRPTQRS